MKSTVVTKIIAERNFFEKCGQSKAYGDIFECCYVHPDWTLNEIKDYCFEKIEQMDDDICKLDDELWRLYEESGD